MSTLRAIVVDDEPLARDDVAMFAHGSPRDPVREYMLPRDITDDAKMRAVFACMVQPICFVGHSHVPAVYYEDRRIYQPKGTEGPYDLGDTPSVRVIVNVGSVGQPRDRNPDAAWAMLDTDAMTYQLYRVAYDIDEVNRKITTAGLPEFLGERLRVGA